MDSDLYIRVAGALKKEPSPPFDFTLVDNIIDCSRALIFPCSNQGRALCEELLSVLHTSLTEALLSVAQLSGEDIEREEIAEKYLLYLPVAQEMLDGDMRAIYDGDPAARFYGEIALCYPGLYATLVYRLAHFLYQEGVPILPRMLSERAHSITGIDIHPGAVIGSRFSIDHGTGVVIGETATVGNNVKIYQGVTLGAKSFDRAPDGSLVKGGKRHPDIRDGVVIYAGATILGGRTVIGKGAVIGGNVWVTESVPEGAVVVYKG